MGAWCAVGARVTLPSGYTLAQAQHVLRSPARAWSAFQRDTAERSLRDAMSAYGLPNRETALAFPADTACTMPVPMDERVTYIRVDMG